MNQQYLKNVAKIEYDAKLCVGCKLCTIVCPHAVFTIEKQKAVLKNKDRCMECGACMKNCASHAIQVSTGVGCATAVINSIIGKTGGKISCDCGSGCC